MKRLLLISIWCKEHDVLSRACSWILASIWGRIISCRLVYCIMDIKSLVEQLALYEDMRNICWLVYTGCMGAEFGVSGFMDDHCCRISCRKMYNDFCWILLQFLCIQCNGQWCHFLLSLLSCHLCISCNLASWTSENLLDVWMALLLDVRFAFVSQVEYLTLSLHWLLDNVTNFSLQIAIE